MRATIIELGTRVYQRERDSVRALLTMPLIYSLTLPFVLLDLWVTAYQWICFPLYGIRRVARRRYFAFDRHQLPYLTLLERANCSYCSYANGVIAYVREVAARTEQYWCPIKHRAALPDPHRRYQRFIEYGDARAYHRGTGHLRRSLR